MFGMKTVNPASTTDRVNRATFGVMPGISCMTITAGPSPFRYTSWVTPSKVKGETTKSSSGS